MSAHAPSLSSLISFGYWLSLEVILQKNLVPFLVDEINKDDETRKRLLADDYLSMNYELHTIRTVGNKAVPDGTQLHVKVGSQHGTVRLNIKLPGQREFRDLGDIPIIDGVVELPLKLVFFSYAREDEATVTLMADKLTEDGFLTWLDRRNLLPGDYWKDRIQEGIEQADYVLLFLSQVSVTKKGYVQKEIKYALEQRDLLPSGRRFIIPILIEPCKPPAILQEINWLHLWEDGAYERLLAALRN